MKKQTTLFVLGSSLGFLHFLMGFAALVVWPEYVGGHGEFVAMLAVFLGPFSTLPAVIVGFCSPIVGGIWLILGSGLSFCHEYWTGMREGSLIFEIMFIAGPKIALGVGFLLPLFATKSNASEHRNRSLTTLSSEHKRDLLLKSGICMGLVDLCVLFIYWEPAPGFYLAGYVFGGLSFLPAVIVSYKSPKLGSSWLIVGAIFSQISFAVGGSNILVLLFNIFYIAIPMLTIGVGTLLLERRRARLSEAAATFPPDQ